MPRRSPRPWFAPKRYGYGAALPITWEGWLVVLIFAGGIFAATVMLTGLMKVLAVGVLIAGLLLISALKTRGGWRWRDGEE